MSSSSKNSDILLNENDAVWSNITENILHSNPNKDWYFLMQLKFAVYALSFWIGIFLILTHKHELTELKINTKKFLINKFILTNKILRLIDYAQRVVKFCFGFNIQEIQNVFKTFTNYIKSISNFFVTRQNVSNNFAVLLFNNIKSSLVLLRTIKNSITSIIAALSFNIKRIVLMPIRIRDSFKKCTNEIKKFWHQMEQIIQIAKLPIEILSLISRFIRSIVYFLQRLEKPKMPRMI